MSEIQTHLRVLGLQGKVDSDNIRRAYRRKAFRYHPDLNKSSYANQEFIRISKAYQFLIENQNRLDSSLTVMDLTQQGVEEYEDYQRTREQSWQEEMARARRNYDQFRIKNANFKQLWYYHPVKFMAYFLFVLIIGAGISLMVLPLLFLMRTGYFTLIMLYVPLLLLGGLVIYYGFVYKIRIDPYFF